MILVDTTVLVHYLRTASVPVKAVLDTGQASICGVTRAEILHGARISEDLERLSHALDSLPQSPIDAEAWDELGRNLQTLRLRGLTVPFPDALIATVAIRLELELWTYDVHFESIRSVVPGLRLFDGPRI